MREGLAAIAEWEADHGKLSEEELERAPRARVFPAKPHRRGRKKRLVTASGRRLPVSRTQGSPAAARSPSPQEAFRRLVAMPSLESP
jgi:hypothetical protein